jgi:hypothetical protein
MKITATPIKDNNDPKTLSDFIMNVTFVPSRITQQGVHRGEDFYSWDDYTFTKPMPFTALTERGIKDNIEWCIYQIEKESAMGIHTYHNCDCGRGSCRSEQCIQCWKEEMGLYK